MPNDHRVDSDWGSDPKDLDAVVRRRQPFEKGLHGIRQGIISAVHVSKHRVAATIGRDDVIVEDASKRRDGSAGLISVPDVASDTRRRLVVVKLVDKGIIGLPALGPGSDMLAQLSEQSPKSHQVVMTDLLLAKKEDLILRKRLTKLVGLPLGKRPGQINLRDLSPDMWRGRRGLKGRVGHDPVFILSACVVVAARSPR